MDFYQIITLIALVTFVTLAVFMIRTLIQVKHTAESVEYVSMLTAENLKKTQSTFDLLDNVSSLLDTGFYKAFKIGMDLFSKYRNRHRGE